jgi:hypothetical protein
MDELQLVPHEEDAFGVDHCCPNPKTDARGQVRWIPKQLEVPGSDVSRARQEYERRWSWRRRWRCDLPESLPENPGVELYVCGLAAENLSLTERIRDGI